MAANLNQVFTLVTVHSVRQMRTFLLLFCLMSIIYSMYLQWTEVEKNVAIGNFGMVIFNVIKVLYVLLFSGVCFSSQTK